MILATAALGCTVRAVPRRSAAVLPPCAEPEQHERARASTAGSFVRPPDPTTVMLLPGAPDLMPRRPITVRVTSRIDSVGGITSQSTAIEGSTNQTYRRQVEALVTQLKFRPGTLLPDGCSVSATSVITFTGR
jgi:hypothetical protein